MTHPEPDVKRQYPKGSRPLLEWIDSHPRTGWYLVFMLSLNFALNLMDALDVDAFWFIR